MLTVGLDTSGLDADFKAHVGRGIGRYVCELKRFFDSHHNNGIRVSAFDHRTLLGSSRAANLLDYAPFGRATLKQQLLYPLKMKECSRLGIDVLHFPAHMDAPSWSPQHYIVTVLDMIPVVCSHLYRPDRPGWRFYLARWLEKRAIQNAAFVLAISENTAQDVHRLLKVPLERIAVTPLGVDARFFDAPAAEQEAELRVKLGIPPERQVVLYVGGIDRRKNYWGLLEVFKRVLDCRRQQNRLEPLLVMAGKIQKDDQYPRLLELIGELGLQDSVILPGFVSDDDLPGLYKLSSVFCFLSLYEGFGLPPLEAMAAGTPVVSSNTSSMPEVLGDAGVLVDPEDYDQIARIVCKILSNAVYADELRRKGRERAGLFPWSRTGEATLEAYRRAAQLCNKI